MKKRVEFSKIVAVCVLLTDGFATAFTLYLCYLSVVNQFTGSLPYLTTLIGALQAATAVVLSGYYSKAKAENSIKINNSQNADRDC